MQDLTARVLIRREVTETGDQWWVAQVLDYDLAAQGQSIDDVVYELQRTLVAHMMCCAREGLVPFECLPPAPQGYHDEYRKSHAITLNVDVRIAPVKREFKRGTVTAIDQLPLFVQSAPPKLEYRFIG